MRSNESSLLLIHPAVALLALPALRTSGGRRVLRDSAPARPRRPSNRDSPSARNRRDCRAPKAASKLEGRADAVEAERSRPARPRRAGPEFQRKRRVQEDLNQRKNEELGAVVERANKAIKQIFDAEKYDLIIQDATFYSPRVDITEKVIKALNAQAGK
jgi:outer membrane protein